MKIYIASSLENLPQVRAFGKVLKERGHSITYDWTTHGPVYSQDKTAAENNKAMREVAGEEIDGVSRADAVVLLLRGGRGTHVELGVAFALHKPVLIVGDEAEHYGGWPCAFYRYISVKVILPIRYSEIVDRLEEFVNR